jgi:hypothetical protein
MWTCKAVRMCSDSDVIVDAIGYRLRLCDTGYMDTKESDTSTTGASESKLSSCAMSNE